MTRKLKIPCTGNILLASFLPPKNPANESPPKNPKPTEEYS
jgi:hypothetical protein